MPLGRLIPLTLALALWAPPAHAAPAASLSMLECTPARDGGAGSVEYRARMHAVAKTDRMAVRFHLLERAGDGSFQRVAGDGLGVWRRSEHGAGAFQWTQRIEGLREGAAYRVVVRYRWLDADGREIRSTRLRSGVCEPDDLPNLRVAEINVKRGDVKDTATYKVKVVNRGALAAHHVAVLLRVDGEVVDESEVIDVLAAGETRTVTFKGPVCRRHMKAIVDPKDLIPETRERDNSRSPGCV